MYEEIKQNLIEHFFNTHYRWTCCSTKNSILGDIQKRCPFQTNIINNGNGICMNLGDHVNISFNLKWEERIYDNNTKHKITNYRLVSIT